VDDKQSGIREMNGKGEEDSFEFVPGISWLGFPGVVHWEFVNGCVV